MPLANRLDDFFKDFIHHVTNRPFEGFVFFWRGFLLNDLDGLIHLTVNAEKHLKDVLCYLRVFKQRFSPWNYPSVVPNPISPPDYLGALMYFGRTKTEYITFSESMNVSTALPSSSYSSKRTGFPTIARMAFWSSLGSPWRSPGGNVTNTTLVPLFGFLFCKLTFPVG